MPITDAERIAAQARNPGIVRLWHALQPLRSVVSFMNTGAHPDDEITAMLAALALRDGLRVSVACSTRGEGGQNNLGTEAGRDLGVVRTAEMERAADSIGLYLYWHSEQPDDTIFDFGFSKSGEETLSKWGHERTLRRFVEIVRAERPDIICPTFLDVPGQHGHHRAMTQLAHEVIDAAADGKTWPELGPAWQVRKLYLPAWSGAGDSYDDDEPPPPETVRIDGAGEDIATGATWLQLGEQSRVFHATQGMGRWIDADATRDFPLHLVRSTVSNRETGLIDGLPSNLASLAELAGADAIAADLKAAHKAGMEAISAWPDGDAVLANACRALSHVRSALTACPDQVRDDIAHRLEAKQDELARIVLLASGTHVRATASATAVRPGATVDVDLSVHAASPDVAVSARVSAPEGWSVDDATVQVPADAAPSNPYPPFHAPHTPTGPLSVAVTVAAHGIQATVDVPLEEPIHVLPATGGAVSPDRALLNLATPRRHIDVSIESVHPADAGVKLDVPSGWGQETAETGLRLTAGEGIAPGLTELPLLVGGEAAQTTTRMSYPHTGERYRAAPAVLTARTMRCELPDARIAYVGGGNDRVDTWLGEAGLNVTSLSDAEITRLNLDTYDTLLVGIFAMRTRPALRAAMADVHDWVAAGGNLVTLYHRPWDAWDPDKVPPKRLVIGKPSLRWRVTDENADVTHLQPDHPVLVGPNPIGPDDWSDWVKERGLYFASEWDDAYTPLLSMRDPDEEPHLGSLLSAEIGDGRHTHTGLILHHQLEHLVPGAYRLLVNLLQRARP